MKIDPPVAAPISLARVRKMRARTHPRGGDFRQEVPTHAPEVMHVDALAPADPDSHEPPEFDDVEITRDDALETARDIAHELAALTLPIANWQASRVHHLFHP
ncbi:hypothetical protein [Maricaulis sp.]|uniref:hypothetical protein n=1 Tax=Maricaulis sp. TaxID=1486257 RepID=UPI0032976102